MVVKGDKGVLASSNTTMFHRLKATLPTGWFPTSPPAPAASATPVLDGLLCGIATAWSFCFNLLLLVVSQTRVSSATGSFLDMISADFFGAALPRRDAENDDVFRARILTSLISRRGTRQDVSNTVKDLVGSTPTIIEPARGADCGGYAHAGDPGVGGGLGYGVFGLHYGSNTMAFQYLVAIQRLATFAPGIVCRRQSSATFIGADGKMHVAATGVLRPLYVKGVCRGALVEPRGINLIKDSRSWSGFAQPALGIGGGTTWMVDTTGRGVIEDDTVMKVIASRGTRTRGPSIDLSVGMGSIVASAWVFIGADSGLGQVELEVADLSPLGVSVYGPADMARGDEWQMLSVSSQTFGAVGKNVTVGLVLSNTTGAAVMLTQCWQVEAGTTPTSYIPTSGTIGIRAQDDVVSGRPAPLVQDVNDPGLLNAIASTIPAATIAWTSIASLCLVLLVVLPVHLV